MEKIFFQVSFWAEKSTSLKILKQKKQRQRIRFWPKSLQPVRFWIDDKNIASDLELKKTTFQILRWTLYKASFFELHFFVWSYFEIKLYNVSDFELMEKENASVFKLNFLQCVSFRLDLFCVARFWNKKDGTC